MLMMEHIEVYGFNAAIRGMRNPMNSWDKSDSHISSKENKLGPNDFNLMVKLRNAGTDHRKYLRMINVYCDITAPLYWWKEFDTYKVGTVANSCSTMHKLMSKPFEWGDFSTDGMLQVDESYEEDAVDPKNCVTYILGEGALRATIETLNDLRQEYLIFNGDSDYEKDRRTRAWRTCVMLLPEAYNQRRTVMMNYETLNKIYAARKAHKLSEWHIFCRYVSLLPWANDLIVKEY